MSMHSRFCTCALCAYLAADPFPHHFDSTDAPPYHAQLVIDPIEVGEQWHTHQDGVVFPTPERVVTMITSASATVDMIGGYRLTLDGQLVKP